MSMTIGSIGGIPMYLFGSIAAVGILLGLMLTRWTAWLYDESFPFAVDVALWGIPLGLIFGRIGHVLRFWEFFADDPVKIMYFWEGGFSPYGAGIGFVAALFLCCKKEGESFWRWMDVMVPAVSLMLVLYAFSGFFLQMTVGMPLPLDIPNDDALAEYVEYSYRPSGFEGYEYFKPVALYQTGLMGIVFLLTIIMTGFFYLATKPGLHMGQIAALIVMTACAVLFIARRGVKKWSVYR